MLSFPSVVDGPRYTAAVGANFSISIRIGSIVLAMIAVSACAHKQTIRLDCVPKDVTIYLDKAPLERVPDSIDLPTSEPHVLFFKGEGYEPTMVVLEIEETADGPTLSPRDLCLDLNLERRKRDLEISIED
jgi:hypothetical protein